MISCPNCGDNLKFDIKAQLLSCDHCKSQFDPYAFDSKTKDAEEEKSYESNYEVTVFTCPQCGGEILSTDNAAAGFCSFCGASTILYSRISHEKRPNYIIPFQKTKEDCKQSYSALMRRAIFAPKELKDPKYIDSFRGIYMPYWAFYMTQKGALSLPAKKEYRRGDYVYTDHFQLTGELDAYYKGLSYDASSSFSDNISEQLAPYDVKGMKAFTPAYLSGFYADTADVDAAVYQPDAEETVYEQTKKEVTHIPAFRSYHIAESANTYNTGAFEAHVEGIDRAMFPVWFMSYRKNDRVAYVTVNGQTGKVVADLPVDPKKYLIGSLLLAVPLFIILALFMTLLPTRLMALSSVIAIISAVLYASELSKIARKDSNSDDRGMLSRSGNTSAIEKTSGRHNPILLGLSIVLWGELAIAAGCTALSFLGMINTKFSFVVWGLISIVMAVILTTNSRKVTVSPDKNSARGFIWTGIAVIISTAIAILHPVSDLFYYASVLFTLVAIGLSFIDIIGHYNILSTRRLPQFDKQGGDDRA